jgi:hypothetical protein
MLHESSDYYHKDEALCSSKPVAHTMRLENGAVASKTLTVFTYWLLPTVGVLPTCMVATTVTVQYTM